ncbi:hypothetical protein KFZ58_04930 [Virgibacillus sp. NKC19-16]|nr:hypothetical protein [Virgibacillus sp. NKC19-16]UJL47258.1 hypothetical protein KFZ58_04930 [Virgibacillus sp. NKC19-16]
MKKMITSLALGSLLLVGIAFAQDTQSTDLSMEMEPSILSVERPSTLL